MKLLINLLYLILLMKMIIVKFAGKILKQKTYGNTKLYQVMKKKYLPILIKKKLDVKFVTEYFYYQLWMNI
jgi:hypothetical protein